MTFDLFCQLKSSKITNVIKKVQVYLEGSTAHGEGGSGGWASGQLLQENDHSPREPSVTKRAGLKSMISVKLNKIILNMFTSSSVRWKFSLKLNG